MCLRPTLCITWFLPSLLPNLPNPTVTSPPTASQSELTFSSPAPPSPSLPCPPSLPRAVAEDYSFADVDVTTEEFIPGTTTPLDLTNIGARAVIGGSSMDWYGASAGGVAYTGTFGVTKYDPAYIFPAQLGGGSNAKYIWEAVSHELGHRLGLGHDGVSSPATTYYSGHANWAPIMVSGGCSSGRVGQCAMFDWG